MSESLGTAVLELAADPKKMIAGLAGARLTAVKEMVAAGRAGKAALAGAIVAGAVVAGVALFQVGEKFEDAYHQIRATTGATGEELHHLEEDFKAVVRDVPDSFEDAAKAVSMLHQRLELTGPALQERAKQFLTLSRITKTDLGENIAAVTRLFGDWSVSTDKQGATLDKLYRVSEATGITVSDLSRSMVQFGSPLRQLGINFDFAAAMFAEFEKNGVNTQTLMPGLRFAIKSFSGAIPKTTAALKDWGINLKNPQVALQQVMKMIKDAPSDLKANAIAFKVFGVRAGPDMAAAIREGHFELKDLIHTMDTGKDTVAKAGEESLSFGDKWKIVKNRVLVAVEPIAMKVVDAIGKLADVTIKVTDGLDGLPGPLKTILSTALPLAAGIIGLVFAFAKLKAAFLAIKALMLANPYVAIIAATIAIAVLIVKNWSAIKGFLGTVWGAIKSAATAVWNAIKSFLASVWKQITSVFRNATVVGLIASHWGAIRSKTTAVWNAIKSFLSGAWNKIKSLVSSAATAVWNAVRNGWNKAKSVTSSVVGSIVSFVRGVPGKIISALTGIVGGLGSKAHEAWSAFLDREKTGISNIVSVAKAIPGKIVSAVGNLGSLLYDEGRAVISGLINGITSRMGELLHLVGGIAGKIKGLKGPIEKDRVLLVDEGAAIIEGLEHGMTSRLNGLLAKVGDVAPTIRATVDRSAQAPAPGNAGPLVNVEHMEVSDRFDESRFASDLAWKVATS